MATATVHPAGTRKPWIAVVLSLLAAGVGQVYAGRLKRGLVFFFITLAGEIAACVVAAAGWPNTGPIAITILLITEAIGLYAVFDAYLVARRADPAYVLRRWNRWQVYLLLILATAVPPYVAVKAYMWGRLKSFQMATDGMMPTLVKGDHVLANLKAYRKVAPARGDVVAWRGHQSNGYNYLRRVVAVAGDTVAVRDGLLVINSRELARSPLDADDPATAVAPTDSRLFWETDGTARYRICFIGNEPGKDFPETTVPPGCVFVLGDNRNHSRDSRDFGPIPIDDIRGKVFYLYWPARGDGRAGYVE